MQRWKTILFNASFVLNCLLLFLLLFESRLSVPAWLQVAGRMHPLILHFPLVLIVLYAVAVIIHPPGKTIGDTAYKNTTSLLLLTAAFTAVITALMGLFLSKEEGYDPQALWWHKWGGVAISLLTLLWYSFNTQIQSKKIITLATSVTALFLIVFTGHLGAGITHGQGFILAPMMAAKAPQIVSPEEAEVYAHMVKPILELKCISCHNRNKAKGELVMETEDLLLKGGKNGQLWDSAAADLGLLMQRVHLPIEKKHHMPPKGKPQLTEEEIDILTHWISKGADFKLRVADLPETDTLHQIAVKNFTATEIVQYDFAEADPSVVSKLNTVNRVVSAEALGSPALSVNFFNSNLFNNSQLKDLGKIKKQIVSLNLAKMPLKDDDIKLISEFENLRTLNLSFTGISGNSLPELKKLKFLTHLAISGTKVTAAQLEQLQSFPDLRTVYAWNTPIAKADMERVRQKVKAIQFETGFRGDTMTLKLFPPVLLNDEDFLNSAVPLKLKHYIQGTTIRYTLDGTEPDSIKSSVFKGTETISGNVNIKAKAYKPGWISSDVLDASFYKNTYTPDSVIYITRPDDKYKDEQNKLLINHERGEADFRFGGWVAFREKKMECMLEFTNAVPVQSITLSSLVDVGSYIMPASLIEIWGGEDLKNLKLLGKLQPPQPAKVIPYFKKGFECKFQPISAKYIRIVATPVAKLPKWHPGKGEKAWIFTDEILVN